MDGDTIEVRRLTPVTRTIGLLVLAGCSVFFGWLAWTQPSEGHEFGWIMCAGLAWTALVLARMPAVVVTADASGFTWSDERLMFLFVCGEVRSSWSDVVDVKTDRVVAKGGSFMRTRITVRLPDGDGTRRFAVTSRARGYLDFVRRVQAATGAGAVETHVAGMEATRLAESIERDRHQRQVVLLIAVLFAAIGLAAALLAKR